MPSLSRNKLMLKLRGLLDRARVVYRDLPHSRDAESEWTEDGPIDITIDKSAAGDTACTVHELLHVQLDPILRPIFDDDLNEVVIRALEEYLVKEMSPKSRSWWRDQIHRRIK